jgi:hypothetical protein
MGDVSEPNNIFIGFRHDPVTYVLSRRQAVSRAFDKGGWNGVWHCTIRKAPAVLQMLSPSIHKFGYEFIYSGLSAE